MLFFTQQDKTCLLNWSSHSEKAKQFHIFKWLPNLNDLSFSNGSKNMRNRIKMALKLLVFQKNYKNRTASEVFAPRIAQLPAAGGFASRPSCVTCLSYISLPANFFHLNIFLKKIFLSLGSSFPFNQFSLRAYSGPNFDLSISSVFVPLKLSFRKFLMTSLQVICSLTPPPDQKHPVQANDENCRQRLFLQTPNNKFKNNNSKLHYNRNADLMSAAMRLYKWA